MLDHLGNASVDTTEAANVCETDDPSSPCAKGQRRLKIWTETVIPVGWKRVLKHCHIVSSNHPHSLCGHVYNHGDTPTTTYTTNNIYLLSHNSPKDEPPFSFWPAPLSYRLEHPEPHPGASKQRSDRRTRWLPTPVQSRQTVLRAFPSGGCISAGQSHSPGAGCSQRLCLRI